MHPERNTHNRKYLCRSKGLLILMLVFIAGCGGSGETPRDRGPATIPAPAPGLWQGIFPCADCPGIEVDLWLRPDGAFFLRQHYLAESSDGERYYGIGRWAWNENEALLRLQGGGPERVFGRPAAGRLTMRVASDLPHTLERSGDLTPFTDTVTLEGEYEGGDRLFRECRSGLAWPVVRSGDYRRLVHQYGRVPRGEQTLVKVRGHLEPTQSGDALVIEELVQLQPGRGCP